MNNKVIESLKNDVLQEVNSIQNQVSKLLRMLNKIEQRFSIGKTFSDNSVKLTLEFDDHLIPKNTVIDMVEENLLVKNFMNEKFQKDKIQNISYILNNIKYAGSGVTACEVDLFSESGKIEIKNCE